MQTSIIRDSGVTHNLYLYICSLKFHLTNKSDLHDALFRVVQEIK